MACVLRSGGDFDASWVRALRTGIEEHLPLPHRFVCLSDVPVPCERIPLAHDFPGWWAKIEVFRLEGRVLYVDLDTLPVGDLTPLASVDTDLALIRDLNPRLRRLQTGVMAFRGGARSYAAQLYEAFRDRASDWLADYRSHARWVEDHADEPDILQDLAPGQIVSYKLDCRDAPPEGPGLVAGHGKPRFSDPEAGWAHRLWSQMAGTEGFEAGWIPPGGY